MNTSSGPETSLANIISALSTIAGMKMETQEDIDCFQVARTQGAQGLKDFLLRELQRDQDIGRAPLPNGKSWIKGLADIDHELALWWANTSYNAWAPGAQKTTNGMTACEELILDMTIQQRRQITPAFAQLVETGLLKGNIGLTHSEADTWQEPLSADQQERVQRAKAFVDRLVEQTKTHPHEKQDPLVKAYIAADGVLATRCGWNLEILGGAGRIGAIRAIQAGYPLSRKCVGKDQGVWWSTLIEYFPRNEREAILSLAHSRNLDTLGAEKSHIYKTVQEIYNENFTSPALSVRKMISYLSMTDDKLNITTPDGDLMWQRLASENGALDVICNHLDAFPELDLASHTPTSNLLLCAAKFGGLAQVKNKDTVAQILCKSTLVEYSQARPLLAMLSHFPDASITKDIKGTLVDHMREHPQWWLGDVEQQTGLAMQVLMGRVGAGWLLEAVPVLTCLKEVSNDLVWSAKLLSDAHPAHPHQDDMPQHWPTQQEPVNEYWLAYAWEYGRKNLPADKQEAWAADLNSLELISRAPDIQSEPSRARPRL